MPAGGWSDTPPICYEMGGLVVDLAVTVDGVKPIGARARRTADPAAGVRLKLCGLHGDQASYGTGPPGTSASGRLCWHMAAGEVAGFLGL